MTYKDLIEEADGALHDASNAECPYFYFTYSALRAIVFALLAIAAAISER